MCYSPMFCAAIICNRENLPVLRAGARLFVQGIREEPPIPSNPSTASHMGTAAGRTTTDGSGSDYDRLTQELKEQGGKTVDVSEVPASKGKHTIFGKCFDNERPFVLGAVPV